MLIAEKFKAIRAAEGLSQSQLCKIIEIPVSTLKNIEAGRSEPNWSTLQKLTQNPRLKKYTLWLMSDSTAPEAGQVEPAIAHIGQAKITLDR